MSVDVENKNSAPNPVPTPESQETLWGRVQRILHNNPIVVVIMLIVISVAGLKDLLDGFQKVTDTVQEYKRRKQEQTSILPCSALGKIKSYAAVEEEKTHFTFTNSSSQDLRLSWINENGMVDSYDPVPSGTQMSVDSYPGHAWLLSNQRGCMNLFVQGTAPSQVLATKEHVDARLIADSKAAKN